MSIMQIKKIFKKSEKMPKKINLLNKVTTKIKSIF